MKIKFQPDYSQSRSDKYQYRILETVSTYDDPDMMSLHCPPSEYTLESQQAILETLQQIQNRIRQRQIQLIHTYGSDQQVEVFDGMARGMSQTDIGKHLGCTQSSITKALNGNLVDGKVLGGLIPKIRCLSAHDSVLSHWRSIQDQYLQHHDPKILSQPPPPATDLVARWLLPKLGKVNTQRILRLPPKYLSIIIRYQNKNKKK